VQAAVTAPFALPLNQQERSLLNRFQQSSTLNRRCKSCLHTHTHTPTKPSYNTTNCALLVSRTCSYNSAFHSPFAAHNLGYRRQSTQTPALRISRPFHHRLEPRNYSRLRHQQRAHSRASSKTSANNRPSRSEEQISSTINSRRTCFGGICRNCVTKSLISMHT
jgi:hypothetical protein